ncbi:MAG: cell division protein FtsL [Gemmatimonadota bacterium]|nr:cell division protein FtsL [Gemmatimonadota bacterium]
MNPYTIAYKKDAAARRAENRRSLFSAGVMVVFLILGVSFLLVYKHTLAHHLLSDVQQLKATRNSLVTERSVLLGDKQVFLSRSRISSYAREQLGLEFPDQDRVRWVSMEALTRKISYNPAP